MDNKNSGRDRKPKTRRGAVQESDTDTSTTRIAKNDKEPQKVKKSAKDEQTAKEPQKPPRSANVSSQKSAKDEPQKARKSNKDEQSTKEPQKKTAIQKVVDDSPEAVAEREKNNKMISNLRELIELVLQILRSAPSYRRRVEEANRRRGGGRLKEGTLIENSARYQGLLKLPTFKIEWLHPSYDELYTTHRKEILNSIEDDDEDDKTCMDWMCNKIVEIHYGKNKPEVAKRNYILTISSAYNEAKKMRDEVDNTKYKNANDKKTAMSEPEYTYAESLHYRLIMVILDALGDEHKDCNKLIKIRDIFAKKAGISESEESDSDSDESNEFVSELTKMTGGKVTNKDTKKIFKGVIGDGGIFKGAGEIFKDMESMHEEGGVGGENAEEKIANTFVKMAPKLAKFTHGAFGNFGGISQMMGEGKKKSKSDESSESSELDSDEEGSNVSDDESEISTD